DRDRSRVRSRPLDGAAPAGADRGGPRGAAAAACVRAGGRAGDRPQRSEEVRVTARGENMSNVREYTALFPFCGLGAGARGFLDAQITMFGAPARFRSVGGIDIDPLGCA